MKLLSNNKFILLIVLLIALPLFVLVACKASLISFTHDESFSYLRYVHESFMDIISYKRAFTNNHILNSVLMKYSEEIFGSSEFTLRLPNILALALYLVYAFKIFAAHTKQFVIPFFILIVFNPYLLEFFGLARGYGLSFAFMLMSIYHLFHFFKTGANKDLILFNAAALLASLSNFTLLNYYVAALMSFNIVAFINSRYSENKEEKFNFLKLNKINFISIVISVMILWEPIRRIAKKNMLDFGGKNGFVADTVASLVKDLCPPADWQQDLADALACLSTFVIGLIFIMIISNIKAKKFPFFQKYPHLVLINLILIFIAASSILQHLFINNDFYIGRFALFLYPLFILNFSFFAHFIYTEMNHKRSMIIFSVTASAALMASFLFSFDLTHSRDWKYDMETKTVMQQLVKEHQENISGKKISLGINWLFEPTTNFYRYIWDLNWLYPTNREGIIKKSDYYYLFKSDSIADKLKDKKVIYSSNESNTMLLKD